MAINFGVTEALARSDLLPGAAPGAFAAVDAHARTRHLQPSDVLVERGDVADEVFVVISGDLEVVLDSGAGEQRVSILSAGAVVGEIGAAGR